MGEIERLKDEIRDLEFIKGLREQKPDTFRLCVERIEELNKKLERLNAQLKKPEVV